MPTSFRVTGPARRFYSQPEDRSLEGQTVTSTHPETLRANWKTSTDAIRCTLPDGSPCYVRPANLQPV